MNLLFRFFFGMIVIALVSCKKDKLVVPSIPHPEMEYFNLNDTSVKADTPGFSIDINHDGRKDLAFTTLLVGDPVFQVDKLQFLIRSNIQVNLPVDAYEQIPVMNPGDSIVSEDFNGYHWWELSTIVLVQKIIYFNHSPVWEGNWKNAVHKYVPYQVINNNLRYNGWVELSVDVAGERVILYKAAVCKEANKVVTAGK